MTLDEARNLVRSPIWAAVRDRFAAGGEFTVHPKGDLRRLEYVDADVRARIDLWIEGLRNAADWRRVVDGAKVRELRERYPGVYPDVLRYTAYFARFTEVNDAFMMTLLKLKFPEVYELCYC